MALLCQGQLTNRAVAEKLYLSVNTVKEYRKQAFAKLGANSITAACTAWRQLKWRAPLGSDVPWAAPEPDGWVEREIGLPVRRLLYYPKGWRVGDIRATRSESPSFVPVEVQAVLPKLIEEMRKRQVVLYNSTLPRIDSIRPSDESCSPPLNISLGEIDYFTYSALSQNLDRTGLLPSGRTIRDVYLEAFVNSGAQFPTTISTGLVIISQDNKLIVAKRSLLVPINPNRYSISSTGFVIVRPPPEHPEWQHDVDARTGLPDLFRGACREAHQEAGLALKPDDIEFFLVALDLMWATPVIYGIVNLSPKHPRGEQLARLLSEGVEINHYEAIEFTPQHLAGHLQRPWASNEKVAVICALIRDQKLRGDPVAESTVLEQLRMAGHDRC